MLIGLAAALVLAVGGFVGWRAISRDGAQAKAPVVTPAGSQEAGAPAAQTDSATASVAEGTASSPAAAESQPATTPPTASAGELKVAGVREKNSAALASRGGSHVTLLNLPSGASVTLDGRRQVGAQFLVRPGAHDLRIEAPGYEPMSRRITLTAGERIQVAFERRQRPTSVAAAAAPPVSTEPPPRRDASSSQGLATLRLILVPPSTISIDGVSKGQQSRVIEEVVPGTHTLRVDRDGWVSKDTVITLSGGQTATIKIQLVERP